MSRLPTTSDQHAPGTGASAVGQPRSSLPPHESARTPAANRRIEDRMMADAKALPPSGLRFWRFADILRERSWLAQETLDMIADALFALGWKIDAARVRMADKSTNLTDTIARIEAEAKAMDRRLLDFHCKAVTNV